MNNVATRNSKQSESRPDAQIVLAALRFLRVLRYRKHYVVVTVIVAAFLGGLYYVTTPPEYEARASLLITRTGPDVLSAAATTTGHHDSLIPTYEQVLSSSHVLDQALDALKKLPPELRIDFDSAPVENWRDILRRNLTAEAMRGANVIEISYRSSSPEAGEAVVRAVADAYVDFMDKHHDDAAAEIVEILDTERKDIEQRLEVKQASLLEIKHRVRDLGLRDNSSVVHPVVQRVVDVNESLSQVQKERLKWQAMQAALKTSVAQGADLRQHLIDIEPVIGREMLLNGLGLSPQITETIGLVERKLIDDRARLKILNQHLGSVHPDVAEVEESVRNAEAYLANCRASVEQRLSHLGNDQLAPLLISMVQQKYAEARAHENELQHEYLQLEEQAVGLTDRMAELQIAENEMQRLVNQHGMLLNRISNVDMNRNKADVRVAIISEPFASDKAVSPNLAIVILFCLSAGVGGGGVLVYVVDLLDDRFRSPDELQEQLALPLLALVRKLPGGAKSGIEAIQIHRDPAAPESEAFRTLRTSLSLTGAELNRVAITSCAPSDGKTTVLSNLAVAYAQTGRRTLLIDADLRRPGLSKLFETRGHGGLAEILRSNADMADACGERIRPTGIENLDILPCGARPADPAELLGRPRLGDLIAWAEDVYDRVLIDCPPILAASDAALVGRLVDGVMLVVNPNENHRRAVLRSTASLAGLKINVVGIVANSLGGANGSYSEPVDYAYGYAPTDDNDFEAVDDDAAMIPREVRRQSPVRPRRAA